MSEVNDPNMNEQSVNDQSVKDQGLNDKSPDAANQWAAEHRQIAEVFTDRVQGVTDWSAQTPVKEWVAKDVVEHLCSWLPQFLAMGVKDSSQIRLPQFDSAHPVASWLAQCDAVQAVLETQPDVEFSDPRMGDMSLGRAISQFYTADVFMHTWDLARATGQDDQLDPDRCAGMFAGMSAIEPMLRASGQFGSAAGPLREGASAQEQLISLIGRDPYWQPAR